MKVKCVKLINPITGYPEKNSSHLTLGKEYIVLEILFGGSGEHVQFRFEHDDNNSPALSHAKLFEIIGEHIPSVWVIKSKQLFFSMSPKAWGVDGFWVAYFDGEPWARELYKQEADKIILEEPIKRIS